MAIKVITIAGGGATIIAGESGTTRGQSGFVQRIVVDGKSVTHTQQISYVIGGLTITGLRVGDVLPEAASVSSDNVPTHIFVNVQ